MSKLTVIAVIATFAIGSQAIGRDTTKMTVKMKPRDRAVAAERSVQPMIQKGPNRPGIVVVPSAKSISEQGVRAPACAPNCGGSKPK